MAWRQVRGPLFAGARVLAGLRDTELRVLGETGREISFRC